MIPGASWTWTAFRSRARRATDSSVPPNIAEGTGRTGRADFRRHRAIARGSAMECGALLDACRILGVAGEAALREARVLLERVVRVLTKMCR
jgi:four helix bundle protein